MSTFNLILLYAYREFLTGFHKRKLQRKKEAKEKFERELKEERKRIKAEAKESYKNMVLSHKPIPELENLLSKEYEDDNTCVKVVELSTDEIAKKYHLIGANTPITRGEDERVSEQESSVDVEECPGMELQVTKKPTTNKQKKKLEFKSEKELKRALKKQATKTVKKSKIFQKKNKLEQQKQKKQYSKSKKQRIKLRDSKAHKGQKKKINSKKIGRS